jgi:hypothetical protein
MMEDIRKARQTTTNHVSKSKKGHPRIMAVQKKILFHWQAFIPLKQNLHFAYRKPFTTCVMDIWRVICFHRKDPMQTAFSTLQTNLAFFAPA